MITIYGTDNCSYCKSAKHLLDFSELDYEYRNATGDKEVQSKFKELFPEAETVPQIIIDGYHIGGYQELVNVVDEYGELIWNLIESKSKVI